MRKTPVEDIREITVPTLSECRNCKHKLMCQIDIAIGYFKPKLRYCDGCGNVEEL